MYIFNPTASLAFPVVKTGGDNALNAWTDIFSDVPFRTLDEDDILSFKWSENDWVFWLAVQQRVTATNRRGTEKYF